MRRFAFLSSRKSWKTLLLTLLLSIIRTVLRPCGQQGDAVTRGTLIILLIMSAVSWYIIFSKLWDQRRLQGRCQGRRKAVLELGLPQGSG